MTMRDLSEENGGVRFGKVLKRHREKQQLTLATLAEKIDRKPQYIWALESSLPEKTPSAKTLRLLIDALALPDGDASDGGAGVGQGGRQDAGERRDRRDWRMTIEMALAAIGLKAQFPLPLTLGRDLDDQKEASEVWVISNSLAEAEFKDVGRKTAENILERKTRYIYFVPFNIEPPLFRSTLKRIKAELGEIGGQEEKSLEDLIAEHVQVVGVSTIALTCRMRIIHRQSGDPDAIYSAGPSERHEHHFFQAPAEMVSQAVRLFGGFRQQLALSNPGETIGSVEMGFAKLLYPLPPDTERNGHDGGA